MPSSTFSAVTLRCVWACLLLWAVFITAPAHAFPGNVVFTNTEDPSGSSGYITSAMWGAAGPTPATTGCTACHTPTGVIPSNIKINGFGLPHTFSAVAGSTDNAFSLTFTDTHAGKGGFLVMHNDASASNANGTLHKVSGDGTVHECQGAGSGTVGPTQCAFATFQNNKEVMHEVPKTPVGGTVTFNFQYNAPATCGSYAFGLWVNDVNNDLMCYNALDYPTLVTFTIDVTCADDGNPCTTAPSCVAGACVYPAGNAGAVCRAAAGECDVD